MSDLKLFRIDGEDAVELPSSGVSLERALQRFVEKNMETLFGVRFLASEYSTGARHRGRIDSLGVDESGAPVILEYKRASESNVINQGLFYLNWLIDHKAEFQLLVQKKLSATGEPWWSASRSPGPVSGSSRSTPGCATCWMGTRS